MIEASERKIAVVGPEERGVARAVAHEPAAEIGLISRRIQADPGAERRSVQIECAELGGDLRLEHGALATTREHADLRAVHRDRARGRRAEELEARARAVS